MNKCRILFYLCISFLVPVFTVQSQTFAQFTFLSIINTVPAPVSIDVDPSIAVTNFALLRGGISENIIIEIPIQAKRGSQHFIPLAVKKSNATNQAGVVELEKKAATALPAAIIIEKNDQAGLVKMDSNKNIPIYNYGMSEEIWKSFAKSPAFTIKKINSNP